MLSQIKSLLQSKAAQSQACKKDGDVHLRADRLDEAERAYRKALSIDPRNADAHVALGHVRNERKDLASAKDALASALSIDPANADAHYMLGTIARAEDDGAAVEHFNRAIESRPNFALAYLELYGVFAQAGHADRARAFIERGVVACPDSHELHHVLGRIHASKRDYAAALVSFRKASALAPSSSEYHCNVADMLAEVGDAGAAIESYGKAVWIEPGFFEARLSLAETLRRAARYDEAVDAYCDAIALRPGAATAHANLGVVLQQQGKLAEATASYRRAVEADPNLASAHANLGNMLMMQGAREEAIRSLERASELNPGGNESHILTALKGGDAERAPDTYVERLFDWYADGFDAHLVKQLQYAVPDKLRDLLLPHAGKGEKWDVLDLGCGTGLAAVAISQLARSQVGVDLSSKMLDKARERNLYERLEHGDLLPMMRGEAAASYDLVIAADVFVYIGKLDELAAEAHRLLRPGTYFAFSVESLDALADESPAGAQGRDYRLNDTGRFAHSAQYLARVCEQSGFTSLCETVTQSRVNDGKGVQGYLVVWKKSSAAAVAGERPQTEGTL
jgi:predicted TPR repeat methyltransferase